MSANIEQLTTGEIIADGVSTYLGVATINVLMKDSAENVLYCTGTTVPTDSKPGFAKGCWFIKTDVAAGTTGLYQNVGTSLLCNFDALSTSIVGGDIALAEGSILVGNASAVAAALSAKGDTKILIGNGTTITSVAMKTDATMGNDGAVTIANNAVTSAKMAVGLVQQRTVTITSAQIVGVAAGQLAHANGVELIPTPGSGLVTELISAVLSFTYGTKAYTGGGNITVNWVGGAAITGLATFAASLGAAANTINAFRPLAAAANVMVSNSAINLVAASAPTQPDTASGTAKVFVTYRTHTL